MGRWASAHRKLRDLTDPSLAAGQILDVEPIDVAETTEDRIRVVYRRKADPLIAGKGVFECEDVVGGQHVRVNWTTDFTRIDAADRLDASEHAIMCGR